MPSHMLGKVALSLAIRRAFPGILVGEDVADDFVPFEREDDGGGYREGGADPVPRRRSPSPGVPAPPPGGAPPRPPFDETVAELGERLAVLPEQDRINFRDWRRSRGFDWPPPNDTILIEMAEWVARVEVEIGLDEETYG